MQKSLSASVLSVLVAVAVSPVLFSQNASPTGEGKKIPDVSGVWDRDVDVSRYPLRPEYKGETPRMPRQGGGQGQGQGYGGVDVLRSFTNEDVPLSTWGIEKFKKVHDEGIYDKDGKLTTNKGNDAHDPNIFCFPMGPTRMYTVPRPFEIRQTADMVIIIGESAAWPRRVYLNRTSHPANLPLQWSGDSIGRYEGDALIVDTVGFKVLENGDAPGNSWLDDIGHPHSDQMHIVETFRRLDHDHLSVDVQFTDPKAYTKTWGGTKIKKLRPPGDDVMEFVQCEDWNRMGQNPAPPEGFEPSK